MMKELKIEKLPDVINRGHGTYSLEQRNEDIAIYRKDLPPVAMGHGMCFPARCYGACFEVFFIKRIDAKKSAEELSQRFGRAYDMDALPDIKEKYPNDEDFGSIAWTYKTLSAAQEKFNAMVELLKTKNEAKANDE